MVTHLIMAGLMLAWLVSPESLALLSQTAGATGMLIIAPLLCGAILAVISAVLIHNPRLYGEGGEFKALSQTYGTTIAAAIALSGRIPMLLFASTAILVSAGFAFNEIFVYWFPNFLFASILLILVGALNILPERFALWGQLLFVAAAVAGLVMLIITGIGGNEQVEVLTPRDDFSLGLFGVGFLLFLGFDLHRSEGRSVLPVATTIVLVFLLLAGWALTALNNVATPQLAESTIGHLLVARAVAGDIGRYMMGAVIICGALSGVNGIFIVVRRTLADFSRQRFFPAVMGGGWLTVIVFVLIIEAMMMTGVAGEAILESQIRASLLLWLVYLIFRLYASGTVLQSLGMGGRLLGSVVGGVIFLLVGSVIFADAQTGYILKFMAVILIGSVVFSFMWAKIYGRVPRNSNL